METLRKTAAERTRLVRRALTDAGYSGRVVSTPASHNAYQTMIQLCDVDAVAAYLGGWLGDLATVTAHGSFAVVNWSETR
jgi:hypothetical protein